MKMGFAETDITPQVSVEMVGFNRTDNMSGGILDCLTAQVSVWEDNGLSCLVTIDNIGFSTKKANRLRDMIGTLICESREKVMLSFSHTHAAVNTDVENEYYEMICRKICDAVKEAEASMTKVSVGWGNAEVKIGVNRRKASPVVDRRVGVLKACSVDNDEVKLIILRLTAHGNVLKADNYLISADYFGAVRKAFQEQYRCPIMVVQGSAGNIAPKYYRANYIPIDGQGEQFVNSVTALEDMAQEVINQVEPMFHKIEVRHDANVDVYADYISLESRVPDMAEAQQIADEALKYCGIDGREWIGEVKNLISKGVSVQKDSVEIQYFCIGDWCLCGIPNETMTEFALETEQNLGNPYFFFNGYTNGCGSYFPSKEEYDLGGYEVYWAMLIYFSAYGRVYPYNRESFDIVTAFAAANYKKCRK